MDGWMQADIEVDFLAQSLLPASLSITSFISQALRFGLVPLQAVNQAGTFLQSIAGHAIRLWVNVHVIESGV